MRKNYLKTISLSAFILVFIACSYSFRKGDVSISTGNTDEEFLPALSAYKLFEGRLADLKPAKGTELYELISHLFVDYAEKQRLIRLPAGAKMIARGNGLPDFPDGTILVKTFYYFIDKSKPSHGRNIVETRLLIKKNSQWKVGTYQWNKGQSEANLITTGTDVNVSWKDGRGEKKKTFFHIPSRIECGECHQSDDVNLPIGLKLRNMNFDVSRNGKTVNQLKHFMDIGWLDSVNTASIPLLPSWENTNYTLQERARVYLDMNCAHCHNSRGSSANKKLFFAFEIPMDSTRIFLKKDKILRHLQSDDKDIHMPSLGTTIIDTEGVELIRQYINGLN